MGMACSSYTPFISAFLITAGGDVLRAPHRKLEPSRLAVSLTQFNVHTASQWRLNSLRD